MVYYYSSLIYCTHIILTLVLRLITTYYTSPVSLTILYYSDYYYFSTRSHLYD